MPMPDELETMATLRQKYARQEKTEELRMSALVDERKADSSVAAFLAQYVPEGAKIDTKKHATKIGAVEAALGEDNPLYGAGTEIKRLYQHILEDEKYADIRPDEAMKLARESAMRRPLNEAGQSREEVYHETTLQKETSWFGKKLPPMPGYEEYKQYRMEGLPTPEDTEGTGVLKGVGDFLTRAGVSAKDITEWGGYGMMAGAAAAAPAAAGAMLAPKVLGVAGLAIGAYTYLDRAMRDPDVTLADPGTWLHPITEDPMGYLGETVENIPILGPALLSQVGLVNMAGKAAGGFGSLATKALPGPEPGVTGAFGILGEAGVAKVVADAGKTALAGAGANVLMREGLNAYQKSEHGKLKAGTTEGLVEEAGIVIGSLALPFVGAEVASKAMPSLSKKILDLTDATKLQGIVKEELSLLPSGFNVVRKHESDKLAKKYGDALGKAFTEESIGTREQIYKTLQNSEETVLRRGQYIDEKTGQRVADSWLETRSFNWLDEVLEPEMRAMPGMTEREMLDMTNRQLLRQTGKDMSQFTKSRYGAVSEPLALPPSRAGDLTTKALPPGGGKDNLPAIPVATSKADFSLRPPEGGFVVTPDGNAFKFDNLAYTQRLMENRPLGVVDKILQREKLSTPVLSTGTEAKHMFQGLKNEELLGVFEMMKQGESIGTALQKTLTSRAIAKEVAERESTYYGKKIVDRFWAGKSTTTADLMRAQLEGYGFSPDRLSTVPSPLLTRMAQAYSKTGMLKDQSEVTKIVRKLFAEGKLDPKPKAPPVPKIPASERAIPEKLLGEPDFAAVVRSKSPQALDDYAASLVGNPEKANAEYESIVRLFGQEMGLKIGKNLGTVTNRKQFEAAEEAFLNSPLYKTFQSAVQRATDAAVVQQAKTLPVDTLEALHRASGEVAMPLNDNTAKAGRDSMKNLLGALGVVGLGSIGAIAVGGVSDAEAGMTSALMSKVVAKTAAVEGKVAATTSKELMEKMLAEKYAGTGFNPVTGAAPTRMRGLDLSSKAAEEGMTLRVPKAEKGVKYAAPDVVARTKGLPLGLNRIMSMDGDWFYKTGYNPQVELATKQTAYQMNTLEQTKYLSWMREQLSGYKDITKETAALTDDLFKKHGHLPSVMTELVTKKAQLEKHLELVLSKAKKPDAAETLKAHERITKQLTKVNEGLERLAPEYNTFAEQMQVIYKGLAEKHTAARVFFAVDDTAEFAKYPFMKDIKLSRQEQDVVNRLKKMYGEYGDELLAVHEKPISGPFIHYTPHPEIKASNDRAKAVLESLDLPDSAKGLAFTKFYSRQMFSMPYNVDALTATASYIDDIERRLFHSSFWQKWNPSGWYHHMKSQYVQGHEPLRAFWNKVTDAMNPVAVTAADKWFNRYSSFEVMRLLSGMASTGLKHLFKMQGTWAQYGFTQSASHIHTAAVASARLAMTDGGVRQVMQKFGVGLNMKRTVEDEVLSSFIRQNKYHSMLAEMEFNYGKLRGFDKFMAAFNHHGGIFIRGAEAYDRVHTILASLDMASKKGMTASDAMYGVFDSIVRNNFLSGALNARWMRDPKIRALMLFQTTPFKIFERRLLNAAKTGESLKAAWGVVKSQDIGTTLKQVADLRHFITQGETALKQNLIADALFSRKDYFGRSATQAFASDVVQSGLIAWGGSAIFDVDVSEHVFHLPFLHPDEEEGYVVKASPIVKGAYQSWKDMVSGNDFSTTTVLKRWLGSQGFIPSSVNKIVRISKDDIPEIYNDGPLKYFFSVPAAKQ